MEAYPESFENSARRHHNARVQQAVQLTSPSCGGSLFRGRSDLRLDRYSAGVGEAAK